MKTKRNQKSGFTLMELIVVMAIIGILITVLAPKIGGIAGRANEMGAKVELTSLYTFEQAYRLGSTGYSSNLGEIGYIPDGIRPDANGCPQNAQSTLPFAIGFPGLAGPTARRCIAAGVAQSFAFVTANTAAVRDAVNPNNAVATPTFRASATFDGGGASPVYVINEEKCFATGAAPAACLNR